MNITLLNIGNELLSGKTQDRNAKSLAKHLNKYSLKISRQLILGDNKDELVSFFKTTALEAELVIVTGGLGPTPDDITKNCLAEAFDLPLCESKDLQEIVLSHYKRIKRDIPKHHAYFQMPKGSTPLHNNIGLAPGFRKLQDDTQIYLFPGVPREFEAMIKEHLNFSKPEFHKKQVYIRTFLQPEEALFNKISTGLWEKLEDFGEVSSLPHAFQVDIGVLLEAKTRDELQLAKHQLKKFIQTTEVAPHVFSFEDESIEEVIVSRLIENNITLSTMESCTGGLIAHKLTKVPGVSSVFPGSIVSYQERVKQKHGVDKKLIEKYGIVSSEIAISMAKNCRSHFETDFSIATTGFAGPTGGDENEPVGAVWIAISDSTETISFRYHCHCERSETIERFTLFSLYKFFECLKQKVE